MPPTSSATGNQEVILADRRDWPRWYAAFKWQAEQSDVWHLVNPDAPDTPIETLSAPVVPPSAAQLVLQLNEQRQSQYRLWKLESEVYKNYHAQRGSLTPTGSSTSVTTPEDPGPAPNRELAEHSDVERAYNSSITHFNTAWKVYTDNKSGLSEIKKYISRTVHADLLLPYQLERTIVNSYESKASTQQIIRDLRDKHEPTISISAIEAAQKYNRVLNQARTGRVDPLTWLKEWRVVYTMGKAYNIPEVTGPTATYTWLQVVADKVYPT
jgi:hypothetical protein